MSVSLLMDYIFVSSTLIFCSRMDASKTKADAFLYGNGSAHRSHITRQVNKKINHSYFQLMMWLLGFIMLNISHYASRRVLNRRLVHPWTGGKSLFYFSLAQGLSSDIF